MITIVLTEAQAELINKVKDYHEKIGILLQSGAFEVKNGKVIVNIDHEGKFRNVVVEQVVYKQ